LQGLWADRPQRPSTPRLEIQPACCAKGPG